MIVIAKTGKGDLLGVFLQIICVGAEVTPPFGYILVALLLDAFGDLGDTLEFNLLYKLYVSLFRRSVAGDLVTKLLFSAGIIVVAVEACRTARMAMMQWMFCLGLTHQLLVGPGISLNRKLSQAVQNYKMLFQAHSRLAKPYSHLFHVCYQAGTMMIVVSGAGFVQGFKAQGISIVAQMISAGVWLVTMTIVIVALPLAVLAIAKSEELIRRWKVAVGVRKFEKGCKQENTRVLRSLRPIAYPVSAKGVMTREVQQDFLARIMFNTQDFILVLNS